MRNDAYAPTAAVDGVRLLRLLADETRLRILALLVRTPDLCVCELVAILRRPQYQISRHLGQLRRSGLLTARREGPFVFYRLADGARRHAVHGPLLRSVPRLAGRMLATQDLGRMRRLQRLEVRQGIDACAAAVVRAPRGRPLLRALGSR
jgi:DNA-binding transcriptional ArsR family regulator